jgi:hypothetical protein
LFFIWVIRRAARSGARLFLLIPGHRDFPLCETKTALLLLPAIALVLTAQITSAADLHLSSDSEIATAGFYQLSWEIPGQLSQIELHESRNPGLSDYRVVYRGPDLARAVSGKSDGEYYYRVVSVGDKKARASNIVKVTVAHHPLKNAFLFFTIGAIVFIAILVAIFQ